MPEHIAEVVEQGDQDRMQAIIWLSYHGSRNFELIPEDQARAERLILVREEAVAEALRQASEFRVSALGNDGFGLL